MPELPEVETVVRALREPLIGRTITDFRTYWPRHIAQPTPEALHDRIIGLRINAVERRAKYIVISLADNETLIIHLRMTGHLSVASNATPPGKYVHTIFGLDNGHELRFRDPRKFGTVALVNDPQEILGKLGPEPLDASFSADVLRDCLSGRKRALKPLLLDQTFVAGIGNIYADEALFHAGLDPRRLSNTLTEDEIGRLHTAIQSVLREGIAREGASISDYVKPDGEKGDMQNAVMVFRRTDMPCFICGTPIERIKMAQRSTHFCPLCQN